MRIGIDAFPALETCGGVGTYVRNLVVALAALESGDEFVAYVPKAGTAQPALQGRQVMRGVTCRETSRRMLRWRSRLDGLDLYHGTNFKLHGRGRQGAVLTIHDLWLDRYPQYSKKLLGQAWSSLRTRLRLPRATRIIAISRHTANDIRDLYGVPDEKIVVIYPGASPEFFPEQDPERLSAVRLRYGIPAGRYILFVGGATDRKNHQVLLEAFARHANLHKDHVLVLVGNPTHRGRHVAERVESLGLAGRVICTGQVAVEELRTLYSHAEVFVFPSLYEGFGFPVLEAMACGAPVITSNRASVPEVAGEAAVLVNPESADEVGQALRRILGDASLRESLRQQGLSRAKQFSWESAARQTLQVYRDICGMG